MVDNEKMKYPKYKVNFVIDNIHFGTEIYIKHQDKTFFIWFQPDKIYTIGSVRNYIKTNLLKTAPKGKYCISQIEKPNSVLEYSTPKELFENTIINDKKLKDIWKDIDIISISGFDKY